MATVAEKKALAETLDREGFAIGITGWPKKATYYKPDGEAMPNLPADANSMKNYMERGFMPFPPKSPVGTATVPVAVAQPALPAAPEAPAKPKRKRPPYVRRGRQQKKEIVNVIP